MGNRKNRQMRGILLTQVEIERATVFRKRSERLAAAIGVVVDGFRRFTQTTPNEDAIS
jgi:hypothetical protein